MQSAWERLLITHIEDATRPIEAEAFAPSEPTMAASIYCIIIEEICAITPGMLSRQTKFICCFSEILEDCSNNFERSKFLLLTVKSIRIKRMNVEIFCGRGVRGVQGTFARAQGRLQGRGGVGHCFWGVRWGKKRVYDFFAADVRFFCKFEFYVHIHYYF